jgi:glycosidase
MKNFSDPDAKVREDFPGGWANDPINKFSREGRTPLENDAFDFTKKLGQWRKGNAWIGRADLIQFVPENNIYVYFRKDGNRLLMCMYNGNDKSSELSIGRFEECLKTARTGKNILTGEQIHLNEKTELAPKSLYLYEINF